MGGEPGLDRDLRKVSGERRSRSSRCGARHGAAPKSGLEACLFGSGCADVCEDREPEMKASRYREGDLVHAWLARL